MKILVTGGAGFIGGNLCKHLCGLDWVSEVRVIDNLSTGREEALRGMPVNFVKGTILDADALASLSEGVDAIVHLAALGSVPRSVADPLASHEANATGTLHVLESARQAGAHVILASSSSVYGANQAIPKVETLQPMPVSPYAVSKLATEQYAMAFANCYGLDVLPFRFFNVFGPGQLAGHVYAAVIPVFVDAALRGEPLPMHGDGEQSRDFTYVGTVCETISEAVRKKVTGGPTNLAFGTRVTLNELVQLLEAQLGMSLARQDLPPRSGDVRASQADTGLLRQLFPEIEAVSLARGLKETVAWARVELEKSFARQHGEGDR